MIEGIIASLIAAVIFALALKKGPSIWGKIFLVPSFLPRNTYFPRINHTHIRQIIPINNTGFIQSGNFFISVTFKRLSIYKTQNKTVIRKNKKEWSKNLIKVIDFYNNHLCEFNYTIQSPLVKSNEYTGKYAKEITNELIMPLMDLNKPEILTIYGKIGCGKSTLISSIINEINFKEQKNAQNKIKTLPIMIDVREDFRKTFHCIIEDDYITRDEIQLALRDKLFYIIRKTFNDNKIQTSSNAYDIDELLNLAYKKLVRPLVVLDELDVVYYEFCKASLTSYNIHQKNMEKFREIIKFFMELPENEAVKGPFQSVLFIISLRETSYSLFCNNNLNSSFINSVSTHRIKLHLNDSTRIQNIFHKRLLLKLNWLKKQLDKPNESIEIIQASAKKLENEKIDYTMNIELSVHGLRHLMNLYNKIDTYDLSGRLLSRFITSPNDLLLIYQFLDGSLNYSQTNEGVSNIFLVNKDYKALLNSSSLYKRIDEKFLVDHLQTYFIKYYILLLIYTMDRINQNPLGLDKIKKIFCTKLDNENSTICEYEIVSLILLHSTEADHGRLVRLELSKESDEVKFRCTTRAAKMFEYEIFWQFKYLMVIIEDSWLGLPTCLENDFKITKKWMRSFEFVTGFSSLNSDEKIRFVKYKSTLTLMFLTLLDIASKYEGKRYKVALSNLKRELGKDIIIPQLNNKISTLKEDIILFSSGLLTDQEIKIVKEYVYGELTQKTLPIIRKKIETHYQCYHGGKNIHSLQDMMKKYHANRSLSSSDS